MRISPILISNKERKYTYVNDCSDLINSALCFGLDYELHHGRIDSPPSRGCSCSRSCPPDPRTPSAVEHSLKVIWEGQNNPTKPPRGLGDEAAWR